jgi:glucose-1-phosphate thymidylyltransferase
VVCDHLLDAFAAAEVRRVFIVLREGKWDIPAYLSRRLRADLDFAYLVTPRTPGSPYTLDVAFPFLGDARVALGFPDILFHPVDAFGAMLRRQEHSRADVVLGLFPAPEPQRMDMVRTDGQGNVLEILIKPPSTTLTETWVTAVWTVAFSRFMHDYLQQVRTAVVENRFPDPRAPREIHVGDVLIAAIAQGMRVAAVSFSGGSCLDVGTPEALDSVLRGVPGFSM